MNIQNFLLKMENWQQFLERGLFELKIAGLGSTECLYLPALSITRPDTTKTNISVGLLTLLPGCRGNRLETGKLQFCYHTAIASKCLFVKFFFVNFFDDLKKAKKYL